MTLLFVIRMLLYVLVQSVVFFHPAIVVSWDRQGIALFFFLIPIEALVAFLFTGKRFPRKLAPVIAGLVLLLFIALFTGLTSAALTFLAFSLWAYISTWLVFRQDGNYGNIAFAETFFLGWVYYKLINYFRVLDLSSGSPFWITTFVFAALVATLFLHSMTLYLAIYKVKPIKESGKEWLSLSILILPVVLLVMTFLPASFVKNTIVLNNVEELKDESVGGEKEQNQINGGSERKGKIKSIPAKDWRKKKSNSGQMGREYAVALVYAPFRTVYLADFYRGLLDPKEGFLADKDQLNTLVKRRFVQDWENPDRLGIATAERQGRIENSGMILSIEENRVAPFLPKELTPTILKEQFYPFEYFYSWNSLILPSLGKPREGQNAYMVLAGELAKKIEKAPELTNQERNELASYLEINLSESDKNIFFGYAEKITNREMTIGQRTKAIMENFSNYYYELQTSEPDINKLKSFLFEHTTGDCSEFSQTLALLARLEGIPSRVVTGFLASDDTQTPLYRRSVSILSQKMDMFTEEQKSKLKLVTTQYRHSWAQLYFSGIGWVDCEATDYGQLKNSQIEQNDLIIPNLEDQRGLQPKRDVFVFPWKTVLRIFVVLLAGVVLMLYLLKGLRFVYLSHLSKKNTRMGLDAEYRLLLIYLAHAGIPLKPPFLTPNEYEKSFPNIGVFASIYVQLQLNPDLQEDERTELFTALRKEAKQVKRETPAMFLRRLISLRGFHY